MSKLRFDHILFTQTEIPGKICGKRAKRMLWYFSVSIEVSVSDWLWKTRVFSNPAEGSLKGQWIYQVIYLEKMDALQHSPGEPQCFSIYVCYFMPVNDTDDNSFTTCRISYQRAWAFLWLSWMTLELSRSWQMYGNLHTLTQIRIISTEMRQIYHVIYVLLNSTDIFILSSVAARE